MGKQVIVELLTADEAAAGMGPMTGWGGATMEPCEGAWIRIGEHAFHNIEDDGIEGRWGRFETVGRSLIAELTGEDTGV